MGVRLGALHHRRHRVALDAGVLALWRGTVAATFGGEVMEGTAQGRRGSCGGGA